MTTSAAQVRPTHRRRQLGLAALLLVPLLWMVACSNGSTPTTPDGPMILQGTVEFQGSSEHEVEMPGNGLFVLRLAEVRILLADISQVAAANLTFGFGLGQRDEAGACILTTNFLLLEGDMTTYRLDDGPYCLTVFDPGLFPENALLAYTLELEISV